VAADDRYRKIAERIIREAIEEIESLSIAEGNDEDLDDDELEKRVRNAVVHIYIPTESGCVCIGLSHQRDCAEWRMPL
jgi:hypothetical protein